MRRKRKKKNVDNTELSFVIDDTVYKDWKPGETPVITPEMERRKEKLFRELDKDFLHKSNDKHDED